jgi:hypothetical protein
MSDVPNRTSVDTDDSWRMIEEAVFRLFDEIADARHVVIGPRLAELGWTDIEAEYPVAACELLFRAQGRSLAQTESLSRVMLAELAALLDGPVNAVVLPNVADGCAPASGAERITGIVAGPVEGHVVVPVSGSAGTMSIAVVDSGRLRCERVDTFDPSVHWSTVGGPLDGDLVEASAEWGRAIAAAHRALATELIALAAEALRIAVEHAKVRMQFGAPIGSFQSPRHALAQASADLEGARALLDQSWRYGGGLSARAAKAAAGRAHREVSDTAMQVCGAIGLTAEHDLHRYVARGLQLDSLCGSHQQLEAMVAEELFEIHTPGTPLPTMLSAG